MKPEARMKMLQKQLVKLNYELSITSDFMLQEDIKQDIFTIENKIELLKEQALGELLNVYQVNLPLDVFVGGK